MKVGALSAVIEEINTCIGVVKSLTSGYYSHKHRQRTLKSAMIRAQAIISAAEKAAQRLNSLLILEMAPEDFKVLAHAIQELRLRTEAAVVELRRYAPTAAAGAAASAERGVSVTAAELTAVDGSGSPDRVPPPPHKVPRPRRLLSRLRSLGPHYSSAVRPVSPHGKGTTGAVSGSAANSSAFCGAFACMRHSAAGEDRSSVSDVEASGGRHWVDLGRRVLACITGTVFSDVSGRLRNLLDAALEALLKACAAVNTARRQVSVAPQRQLHYVRPPLFRRVAEELYDGPAQVVVVYGAPALGKSSLADEIRWLVNSTSMLAEKFTRTAYYLCKDGKCENYAEVYRSWTDRSASSERTNFEIVQDLAHHAGTSASLLLLDNLEDPSCFYQHGALSELVRRLGNSRLLITTSTRAVCNTLPGALCLELTCAENEEHVMFELAARLVRGDARRADAGVASPDVKASIRSCVLQCQGSPHLLKLVDSAVRLRIMDPELHSTANTLSDVFEDAWRACAARLIPSVTAAQADSSHLSTYDTPNHRVYLHLLRMVTALPRDSETPTAAARMAKAVLRAVVQLNSRQWYPWDAVAAAAAEEATPGVPWYTSVASSLGSLAGSTAGSSAAAMPFACTAHGNSDSVRVAEEPDGGDGLGHVVWSAPMQEDSPAPSPFVPQSDPLLLDDIDGALLLLVRHRVLEMRARRAGQGSKAELRFHELLRQCLEECAEARALVGLPPPGAPAEASVWQYFLNNFAALTGRRS